MAVDPSLRAAVDGAFGAAPPAPTNSGPLDPLEEMRRLARETKDARVKAQLLRILREEEKAENATPENALADLSDEDLYREADEAAAFALNSVLTDSSLSHLFPMTRGVIEKTMDRKVEERVAVELGKLKSQAVSV